MAGLILKQQSAATQTIPSSGKDNLFFDTDSYPKYKDSAGNVWTFGVGVGGGTQTIVTAVGTTTLTQTSPRQTIFTGTNIQTLVLPSATTLALDWRYELVNLSTGAITVQTNGGATIATLATGEYLVLNCTSIGSSAGTWQLDFLGQVQPLGTTSTATAAGTTTLTVASTQTQVFTGSAIQTVVLPAANLLPFTGWFYCIVNQSTGALTVQANGGATIATVATGAYVYLTCTSIGSGAGTWSVEYLGQSQPRGTTTTAMSGGTTTLTMASTRQQIFSGSGTTAQIVILPDARTLPFTDWTYEFDNVSTGTGALTVQTSGGAQLVLVQPGGSVVVNCTSIGTQAGTWDADYQGNVQGCGTQTIAAAGGTTAMTMGSPRQTIVTGSVSQTIVLPDARTIPFVAWSYEIVNQSTVPLTIQTSGGTVLFILPAGFDATLNCTSIATQAGTWQFLTPGQFVSQFPHGPSGINGLEMWGHSYLDETNVGNGATNLVPNANSNFGFELAAMLNIPANQVNNHAVTGSALTNPVRAGSINVGGGFAKVLAEIYKTKMPFYPFARNGNAHLICTGVNDTGNNTAANQALVQSTALDILTVLVSKMRASVIINGNTSTLGLTYSGTWAAAAAAAVDYTSGNAWASSTTGNTFTFVIPEGYKGEPITFAMVGYSSANACSVTFSGTAGVTGTTTLNSRAIGAQSIVPKRITNLTAANAGQTIIGTISVTSQTFILDGVYIEALKPVPVLICNQPRLPCRVINIASGAGVTTGVNTSFTDASVNFLASSDAGAVLTETDAQGAFTGNTNTVSSVTNATTVVLGTNAAAAKTAIQYTMARKFNGYAGGNWSTNTNFTGATPASHSAADTDVTNWNTNVVVACKNLFDSMVQIVDLDAAIGQDATCPPSVYSWMDSVSWAHPNDLGNQMCSWACWKAVSQLQQPATDLQPFGPAQNASAPTYRSAGYRRIILNTAISNTAGGLYLPDGAQIDVVANGYTCVLGETFAYPFLITEASIYAMGCKLEQISSSAAATVRVGIYDDIGGPGGPWGYPQCLRMDGGNTVLTTTNAIQTLGNIYRTLHPGLWWLVLSIQVAGTSALLRTIYGPSPMLPSWNGTLGGAVRPIAWKVTGVAAGNLPEVFPAISGAILVGSAGGSFSTSFAAPLCSLMLNVF